MKLRAVFERPYLCLLLGLIVFPIAKLFYIPNYAFNFLTTLVHEVGHSIGAWLMGMPSIPSVSVAGGGVTMWSHQVLFLVLVLIAAQGAAIYHARHRKFLCGFLIGTLAIYSLFAFTSGREIVAIAGGMVTEVVGAAICFAVCLGVPLERPFERPLYALWGWWMLLNRSIEAFLMLTDPGYRDAQRIIGKGLAAGLPSDLTQLSGRGISAELMLVIVLLLGLLSLPVAMVYAHRAGRQQMLIRD